MNRYRVDRADKLQAEIEALRAEVERLNRILGRIVEGDGDSTVTIRAGTDAFAAAREYLVRDREEGREISGYTCTVPDDCETLHWRGQILSMNELVSAYQSSSIRYERELKEWIERGRTAEEKAAALKWLEEMSDAAPRERLGEKT